MEIQIKDLIVYTKIGCYEWEKFVKQKVIINVKLVISNSKISNLEETVDYHKFSEDIKSTVSFKEYDLIENIAEGIYNHIVIHYKEVKGSCINVYKPMALDGTARVECTINTITGFSS